MSTKHSLKFERDQVIGQQVHLYQDVFDEEHVRLVLEGLPFEATSSVEMSGRGSARLSVRFPNSRVRKLGLLAP